MRSTLTLVLTTALAAGCGGLEGDGELMGPRGGVLLSEDGQLTVEIREDALEDEMEIAVVSAECDDPAALACYAFEPWGVMLAAPAWVVFDPQAGGAPIGMPSDQLMLQVEGPEGYVPMSDANYDADEGTAWASVMYLTSVTVVAQ